MVPNISQVRPGSAVSIVLKQDQPTGRQVPGTVREVLTSGDHPRGIKVRLSDGRIGRVQRMVIGEVSTATPDEVQKDLQDQQVARGTSGRGRGPAPYRSHRLQTRYSDVREEDGGDEPPAELDLMAFVKQPKQKKKNSKKQATTEREPEPERGQSIDASTTLASCPVCGNFEGDEAAVSHHVAEHFATD